MPGALARGYTGTQIFNTFGGLSESDPGAFSDSLLNAFLDGRWIRHGGGSTNSSSSTLVVTGCQAKLQVWTLKNGLTEATAQGLEDLEMLSETGYAYSASVSIPATTKHIYIVCIWQNSTGGTMVSLTNTINNPPTAATPSISFVNQGGQYYAQITCATMGVTLQYGFNNSTPSNIYPSAVPCYGHSGQTLYAQACGHGYQPGAVASVTVP